MFRRILICLVLLSISAAGYAAPQPPEYLKMTLLTTNDLHGNLTSFDYGADMKARVPEIKDVGGAARRATIIRRIRGEMTTPVLLFDSGDTTLGRSSLSKTYHGTPDTDAMNAIGYDAMGPGNHDFQWHSSETLRNIKLSRFPWVCANLVDEKTGKPFLQPYVIREIGGVKVAIMGLITTLVMKDNYPARKELGLTVASYIDVASKLVPELRKQADIVIVLSHLGVKEDAKLAETVPGIDIILGGHSHTRLPQPRMVPCGEASACSLGAVPIVQAFQWGSEMGRTDVVFHRDQSSGRYTLMSCQGKLISIDKSIPDDPQIAEIVHRYEARISKTAPAVAK